MLRTTSFLASVVAAPLSLCGQSYQVVPTAYTSVDAPHICALPGAASARRHQVLVGASHLTAMQGKSITGIALRRSADPAVYQGGVIHMSVRLSHAAHSPLGCSSDFDANLGPQPQQVYDGDVTVPTSPGTAGPSAAWSPSNIAEITFTAPFLYQSGDLCVDIIGTPVAGQEVQWWMSDAEYEDVPGSVTDLGGGCGAFAGGVGTWSDVDRRSLVVGGYTRMHAFGTPYGLAIAAVGPSSAPLSLSALGFQPPGACDLRVFPLDILVPAVFVPDPDPLIAAAGGRADLRIKIPNIPGAAGLTLTTQWFDWSSQTISNALEWTVSPVIPSLDMAMLEGHPQEQRGAVSTHIAHVLRFEYQ